MKREFLQLAHEYNPQKHDVTRWYMSEKLDGQRAFWDGGISRGIPATQVPYANTAKDARYLLPPTATGLWSRYGKVIHAPGWWLDGLPTGVTLDMELWMGRGRFQELRSTTSTLVPNDILWRQVVGCVLDSPSWMSVLEDGELTGPNWKGYLGKWMIDWVEQRSRSVLKLPAWQGLGPFDETLQRLRQMHSLRSELTHASWQVHQQVRLPMYPDEAAKAIDDKLNEVCALGGEGLVLRRAAYWVPKRTWDVLKVKKLQDAEATVVGFTWGRKTELGSKHLGRMGALVTEFNGKRLELSGFTDEEREVAPAVIAFESGVSVDVSRVRVGEFPFEFDVPGESYDQQGKDASKNWQTKHFPRGSKVTFTYRELSDDGIPKEARYLRKREAE